MFIGTLPYGGSSPCRRRRACLALNGFGSIGPAAGSPAGGLRVVVGVAGDPAQLQRRVLQHERQHLRAAVEVGVDALGIDDVADDAVQVRRAASAVSVTPSRLRTSLFGIHTPPPDRAVDPP